MPQSDFHQIRQKYLEFFAATKPGHAVVPSSALVPENDPTTLFTGSGMQPMVPYLLGEQHPKGTRITDSQKCFRSQDIEEVGDNRHTTFFEMLGNWSLGDYFKHDQLRWFFTFLTEEVGLAPERLFVTVFRGSETLNIPRDSESVSIWQELFQVKKINAAAVDFAERDGMQDGRIFYYDETKNWWSRSGIPTNMPAGEPGGPDSEVFYDFGVELHLHEQSAWKDEPCHVNCDCGRFLEIGNSVFMQYQKQADGIFTELPQKNVDFGGGLERITAAANGDSDVFKTTAFSSIIDRLEKLSGFAYDNTFTAGTHDLVAKREVTKHSFRVIADHIKAATFLIGDGVFPSNKQQGYFVRRLIRRAVRYGKLLGIDRPFVAEVADSVIALYRDSYPTLNAQQTVVLTAFQDEEAKFLRTLEKGLKEIQKVPVVTGEIAFKLYETYGFPWELSEEIARERGQQIDRTAFETAFNQHKNNSRTSSAGMFKGGLADHSEITTKYHTATHLLQAALRQVLGNHVQQKGSNITAERLRFDFAHQQAVTAEELAKVETQINEWIKADLTVTKLMMEKQAALQSGAIAFFIEKYPDEVSVYTIGNDPEKDWISKEFCGGPHVTHSGEIGEIKIIKEQAVSAGVRRIYAELR